MPKLRCDVSRCAYNRNELCNKDKIYVGGLFAEEKQETECISFERKPIKERYTEEYSSEDCSDASVCEETKISCSSERCIHNFNKVCKAENVKVSGHNAITKDETCCDTFKM